MRLDLALRMVSSRKGMWQRRALSRSLMERELCGKMQIDNCNNKKK